MRKKMQIFFVIDLLPPNIAQEKETHNVKTEKG